MTAPATTFWRIAGMTYLQFLSKSTSTIRMALKEPAKRKAMDQELFSFNTANWADGKMLAKFEKGTGSKNSKKK